MYRIMLGMLGSCLVLTTLGYADERNKGGAAQQLTDEQFVMKASEAGMAEVNHGMLAAQRATRPEVKEFAQRMVKDHGSANKELLGLVNKKGFKVAKDMGEKHQAMQTKLSGLTGEEFDRQYMHHMIEGHQKAVDLFKAEAKNGKDEDLRKFAEKTLPTIEDHLRMARQIHDKFKGGK